MYIFYQYPKATCIDIRDYIRNKQKYEKKYGGLRLVAQSYDNNIDYIRAIISTHNGRSPITGLHSVEIESAILQYPKGIGNLICHVGGLLICKYQMKMPNCAQHYHPTKYNCIKHSAINKLFKRYYSESVQLYLKN